MAKGDYLQFLNSGDCLFDNEVVGRMAKALVTNQYPSILYGNMIIQLSGRKRYRDCCFKGQPITFLGFYNGTINHSPAYIKRELFEKYGTYDTSLRIVSDWKWYLQAIILGGEKPAYTSLDVTVFDMNGISETNAELCKSERNQVLAQLFPTALLADYHQWAFAIDQMKRLQRHPWAYHCVWFLERCLFKWEKWFCNKEQVYR